MATKRNNSKTQDLTLIAIFSALVIVLQFFAGNFSAAVGVNFTLALTPIILCGAIVGIKGG
ncbi:MAG: biotin transporter BioY, partial [Clostridia bacterium]|nr:biotin transporter BioY [Clostridia bacterium]